MLCMADLRIHSWLALPCHSAGHHLYMGHLTPVATTLLLHAIGTWLVLTAQLTLYVQLCQTDCSITRL